MTGMKLAVIRRNVRKRKTRRVKLTTFQNE